MNEQTHVITAEAYMSVTSQKELAADVLNQAKQDRSRSCMFANC